MTTELSTEVLTVEAKNPLVLIQEVLSDPNTDPEKMDKLLAMYERMDAKRAEREFFEAMAECKAELPAVVKDKVNDHTKKRYASLEQVSAAIDPIITRHGFTVGVRQGESKQPGWIKLIATVRHRGGHSEETELDLPVEKSGGMNAVQAVCSSVSYGRRYLKCMVFDLAIADSDKDGNQPSQFIDAKQLDNLARLIDETETDAAKFLKWAEVDRLEDLPLAKYRDALTMLNKKRGGA